MNDEYVSLNSSSEASMNLSTNTPLTATHEEEAFLHFDANSELSLKDKSRVYCSLVALVKAEHPFDDALQGRAALFLKNLEPSGFKKRPSVVATELVPSSSGSLSGFVASIVTLLSSAHSRVVAAVLSFLNETTRLSSSETKYRLVESDLVTKILAFFQPHTLPISGNEATIDDLIRIILNCLNLASPQYFRDLDITAAVDEYNHRKMIFRKAVIPSSQFVTFLISNRHIFKGWLFDSFMLLLVTHIRNGPFHRPTLEFILASPIVMGFSSCFSFVEDIGLLFGTIFHIHDSLEEWIEEGPEVAQSGKRMIQALFSEGFEDTLEQMLRNNMGGDDGFRLVEHCHILSQFLGSNVNWR